VADLLAHLVVRERRPDLAAGIWLPPLRHRLARGQGEVARADFADLVERVRSGPPAWHPAAVGVVDDRVNLVEMFVHHEDIRRANGRAARPDLGVVGPALARTLRLTARLLFRRAATGVVLEPDGGEPITAKGTTDRGTVTLRGPSPELVLYGYGRTSVAEVVADGDPAAVAALAGSRLGLG
jgi:uncharacterized protein (TIGR03085 family)